MDVRTSDLPRRLDSLALPMRAQSLHSGCQSLTPKNAARHGQVHPYPADRHQPTQVPELTTKVLKWGAEIEWPFLAQSRHSSPGDQPFRLRRRLPMHTAALVLAGNKNDAGFQCFPPARRRSLERSRRRPMLPPDSDPAQSNGNRPPEGPNFRGRTALTSGRSCRSACGRSTSPLSSSSQAHEQAFDAQSTKENHGTTSLTRTP